MTLSPAEYPVDRVMGALEYSPEWDAVARWNGEVPNLPADEIADLQHQYRDQAEDDAETTLREESDYYQGMSIVEADWFFNYED